MASIKSSINTSFRQRPVTRISLPVTQTDRQRETKIDSYQSHTSAPFWQLSSFPDMSHMSLRAGSKKSDKNRGTTKIPRAFSNLAQAQAHAHAHAHAHVHVQRVCVMCMHTRKNARVFCQFKFSAQRNQLNSTEFPRETREETEGAVGKQGKETRQDTRETCVARARKSKVEFI